MSCMLSRAPVGRVVFPMGLLMGALERWVCRAVKPPLLNRTPNYICVAQYEQILMKEEELYDLMSDFHSKFRITGSRGWRNSELLHSLSAQVEPRHDDSHWRLNRRCQSYRRFFTILGAIYFLKVFPMGLGWLMGYPEPTDLPLAWFKKSNQ
ncbi:hypothetical protein BRADI_2g14353v3 [Brachypodium distachyon]|uniref:Uncharacterized protein n=1 Tax=Brachypodium distachyon TaxID=15368 RepID=A0A0Q3IVR8_BRADI|nr:hypothetical protein BRADI_2g14353v3 [Brachypodium distachyon]